MKDEDSFPPFPTPGSILNHRYLTIGRLGRGTFCAIHKCIDLQSRRVVAAKVELADFTNSGVLDGEAIVLEFLSKNCEEEVPEFIEYVKCQEEKMSAIIMEFLGGEDMHMLRDKASTTRRMNEGDAVNLTAEVMLPLLEKLHTSGVIHRDVKPSNCVRVYPSNRFKLVDFGLSKSFVVPKDSPYANTDHPWEGVWSSTEKGEKGCIRKERPKAEFRGTSMYASLPVHEVRDYAPRDDIWSLLYVFCDLVSGGLPWMRYAADRDRESCRKIKSRIHTEHHEHELIMGATYYKALYDRDKNKTKEDLPQPLFMSTDPHKVACLRKAFSHLAQLTFYDKPDYTLIKTCIQDFLKSPSRDTPVPPIHWDTISNNTDSHQTPPSDPAYNSWMTEDLLTPSLVQQAESERSLLPSPATQLDMSLQLRLGLLHYISKHPHAVPKPTVLKDWIYLASYLTKHKWDASKYENAHRKSGDGYRNENYIRVLEKCLLYAKKFGNYREREYYARQRSSSRKKRKRLSTVSVLFCDLRGRLRLEREKPLAPPPSIFMS